MTEEAAIAHPAGYRTGQGIPSAEEVDRRMGQVSTAHPAARSATGQGLPPTEEIPRLMATLESEASILLDRLSTLELRLSPILGPEAALDSVPELIAAETALGTRLQVVLQNVLRANTHVSELERRARL